MGCHCTNVGRELLFGVITVIFFLVADATEYCNHENFQARCKEDQIIMIQSAKYGRMRKGKCIDGEGQMHCEQDVTTILHRYCSGKKSCQMAVSDLSKMRDPCKKDYVSYLDATFHCKDVASGTCVSQHQIELKESSGILPSLIHSPSAGVIQCPWAIHAKEGQRVQLNITVFNSSDIRGRCPYSVMINDGDGHVNKEICDYSGTTRIYTSTNHVIEVYNKMQAGSTALNAPTYVINYQVIGCADFVAPSFSSVKRTGNDLEVRCSRTKETWFLTCKHNAWIGEIIGNCSSGYTPRAEGVSSDIPFPQGLIAAVILGIVLGVIIGFTSLGIYIMHRRRKLQQGAHLHSPDGETLHYERKEQYGEVPLYRETASSSTYYTGSASQQYGTTLNRPHMYEPPIGQEQGGGDMASRPNINKTHLERDIPQHMRRDML